MSQRLNYYSASPDLAKNSLSSARPPNIARLGIPCSIWSNIRASQLNGCAFCVDVHTKEAKIHGERELRLYHLPIWRESTLFSETERAALEWTEAVTKLTEQGVADEVYDRVRAKLSETQISELTFAIGVINTWNRLNIACKTIPGSNDERLGLTKAGLN